MQFACHTETLAALLLDSGGLCPPAIVSEARGKYLEYILHDFRVSGSTLSSSFWLRSIPKLDADVDRHVVSGCTPGTTGDFRGGPEQRRGAPPPRPRGAERSGGTASRGRDAGVPWLPREPSRPHPDRGQRRVRGPPRRRQCHDHRRHGRAQPGPQLRAGVPLSAGSGTVASGGGPHGHRPARRRVDRAPSPRPRPRRHREAGGRRPGARRRAVARGARSSRPAGGADWRVDAGGKGGGRPRCAAPAGRRGPKPRLSRNIRGQRDGSGRGGGHGAGTAFGDIAARLSTPPPETEFQRGIRQFSMLIMRTVAFLVLFVVVVNVALHRLHWSPSCSRWRWRSGSRRSSSP